MWVGNCAKVLSKNHCLFIMHRTPVPWRTYPRHLALLYRWHGILLLFLKSGSSNILSQQQRGSERRKWLFLRFNCGFRKHHRFWPPPPSTFESYSSLRTPETSAGNGLGNKCYRQVLLYETYASASNHCNWSWCVHHTSWLLGDAYIYKAVQNIAATETGVQSMAMKSVCRNLFPQFADEIKGFYNVVNNDILVTTRKRG